MIAILLFVSTTYVSSGDATLIITAAGLGLFLQERRAARPDTGQD